MIGYQRLDVDTRRHSVGDAPFARDHDTVGRGGATEHQGGQRIAGTRETQFVEPVKGQIRLTAQRDAADIVAAKQLCRASGSPAKPLSSRVEVPP